jgi:cytochrome c oxidase subunit II
LAEIAPSRALLEGHAERTAHRAEMVWAWSMAAIMVALVAVVVFSAMHWRLNPPSSVETIDSTRLQLGGEFSEGNLGTSAAANGAITVRLLAQQYAFSPNCILVPADTPVTLRGVSADVVHGFLIQGTNVNTMLVPGYVATLTTRFRRPGDYRMPCHEFCGVGHQGMWAHVRVVAPDAFPLDQAKQEPVSCERH